MRKSHSYFTNVAWHLSTRAIRQSVKDDVRWRRKRWSRTPTSGHREEEKEKRSGKPQRRSRYFFARRTHLHSRRQARLLSSNFSRADIQREYSRVAKEAAVKILMSLNVVIRANVYRVRFVHPVNDHQAIAFLRRRDYIFLAYLEIILFAIAIDIFMNLSASALKRERERDNFFGISSMYSLTRI